MLGRKQSIKRTEVILADYGPEEAFNESIDIEWVNKAWVRRCLRICALISLVSICLNTPHTYKSNAYLIYITLFVDICVTLLFTAEMMAKVHIRGFYKGEAPYIKDKWCQFDAVMVLFLWISILLHVFIIIYVACFKYFENVTEDKILS
jgi:voltage-gated ion channel